MTTQPEALRLAITPGSFVPVDVETTSALCTELRRLHAVNQELLETLRVLSLALEEAPGRLTPKQRSVWEKSRDVLCSAGGWA